MSEKQPCPYKSLPDSAYWRRSVERVKISGLDPVTKIKFKIAKTDKVATAGSCFAQHIARFIAKSGFNYYIVESGHILMTEEIKKKYNYGTFSCRYGNIYSSRQLLQLIKRAQGTFIPKEELWLEKGRYYDPFRPHIQPNGFLTLKELEMDRFVHLRAIRKMISEMDVFVFTLGLTEAWQSRSDGTIFPLCPGCSHGEFNSQEYEFVNLSVSEVVMDISETLKLLREYNSKLRVILTVSPVPLIATYTSSHVLQATTYSKSVLRVAAEEICRQDSLTDYFPSYEIITGSFNRGSYFESDLRGVSEVGVQHAMRIFMQHYTGFDIGRIAEIDVSEDNRNKCLNTVVADVVCDEERILD